MRYLEARVDFAPTTRNRKVSDLKNWVLPELGRRSLRSITQPDVKAWVSAMVRSGCNPGSVKLRYETVASLMRAAVDAELIRKSRTDCPIGAAPERCSGAVRPVACSPS